MEKTKYVTIESYGSIKALGGIMGPITTPCYINTNIIISLINSGKVVYEVNPENTKEKVRLNRDNVLKNNFDYLVKKEDTKNKAKSINVTDNKGIKPHTQNIVKTDIVNNKSKNIGIDLFISNKYS